MARTGKIARLPDKVREELNLRLQDGKEAGPLMAWLNGLPAVKRVLASQFGGKPIRKQNLSEWRSGGFVEWQMQKDLDGEVGGLKAVVSGLAKATDDESGSVGDMLSLCLEARYARLVRTPEEQMDRTFDARLRRMNSMCLNVARMRRGDHTRERLWRQAEREEFLRSVAEDKGRSDEELAMDRFMADAGRHKDVQEAFEFALGMLHRREAKDYSDYNNGITVASAYNEALAREQERVAELMVKKPVVETEGAEARPKPLLAWRDWGNGRFVIDLATDIKVKADEGSCKGLSVPQVQVLVDWVMVHGPEEVDSKKKMAVAFGWTKAETFNIEHSTTDSESGQASGRSQDQGEENSKLEIKNSKGEGETPGTQASNEERVGTFNIEHSTPNVQGNGETSEADGVQVDEHCRVYEEVMAAAREKAKDEAEAADLERRRQEILRRPGFVLSESNLHLMPGNEHLAPKPNTQTDGCYGEDGPTRPRVFGRYR